jgi:MFS family permease
MSGSKGGYKWTLLIIIVAAIASVSYTQFQITASSMVPVLFETLGIGVGQFSALTTSSMLVGVIFAILGGVIADKLGPKKTCAAALALSLIGAVIRTSASSYGVFFLSMFLIGFGGTFLSLCSAKLFAAWFKPEEMGLAMGCMMSAGSLGTLITNATTNAAFNGNIQAASRLGAGLIAVMLVIWILFVKEKPEGAPETPSAPVMEPLKIAARSRNVWIIGIAAALAMGFQMALNVNYQSALALDKGLSDTQCSLYSTLLTIGGALGSILVPNIIAKIGVNKPSILGFGILGGLLVYVGWSFCSGAALALLVTLGAFFGFGAIPPLMGYPPLLKEIGPKNAGSASGIITTVQMAGAFFLPSYVLSPLATSGGVTNYGTLFALGALCSALMGIVALALPELGTKALKKEQ